MPVSARAHVFRNAVAVSGAAPQLYALIVSYLESDPLTCKTQILRFSTGPDGDVELALDCDDPLAALWVSPSGEVWAAAATGVVWTTHSLPNQPIVTPYRSHTSDLVWHRETLPPHRKNGLDPNVASLFGLDNQHIYAATFSGTIYLFDGSSWTEMQGEAPASLIKVHGTAPDRLSAVGMRSGILRCDGARWTPVSLSSEQIALTICRAVCVTPDTVYVVTRSGHLLREEGSGFRSVASLEGNLNGVIQLGDRILVAAAPGGVLEWIDGRLVELKGGFSAIDAYVAGSRGFFIESGQLPDPRVVEYNPAGNPVWARREFPLDQPGQES